MGRSVTKNGALIAFAKQTQKNCEIALKQNPYSIESIDTHNLTIIELAMDMNPNLSKLLDFSHLSIEEKTYLNLKYGIFPDFYIIKNDNE